MFSFCIKLTKIVLYTLECDLREVNLFVGLCLHLSRKETDGFYVHHLLLNGYLFLTFALIYKEFEMIAQAISIPIVPKWWFNELMVNFVSYCFPFYFKKLKSYKKLKKIIQKTLNVLHGDPPVVKVPPFAFSSLPNSLSHGERSSCFVLFLTF